MSENVSLKSLENQFSELTRKLGEVQGEYNYIADVQIDLELNILKLDHDKEIVELIQNKIGEVKDE